MSFHHLGSAFLFCAATIALNARAQSDPLWLRGPAISPDGKAIVFCYKGDLWRVTSTGGDAQLLTTNGALDFGPVWSHDGATLAFSSMRYGNSDVFTMPSIGGPATRLTFNSGPENASDFAPDDSSVIFYGGRQDDVKNQLFPVGGLGELYSVPTNGGRVHQILTIPAVSARYNPSGTLLVYNDKKGYENGLRKHHISSVTRDIWTYDLITKQYKQISTFPGEDRNPVFSADGKTIYYLSEEKGSFNIFKMPVGGGASTQVSFLTDHPVRSLSISTDGTLCFSYRGELYTMKEGSEPKKVGVRVEADERFNAETTISVNGLGERDGSFEQWQGSGVRVSRRSVRHVDQGRHNSPHHQHAGTRALGELQS